MFATKRVDIIHEPMQGSLLTMGEPEVPAGLDQAKRIPLGNGAWLDHLPAWLPGADAWFDAAATMLHWQHARRPMYDKIVDVPRLIWSRPDPDAANDRAERAVIGQWEQVAELLADHYRRPLPRLHANYYRNGNDSVAWHRDKVMSPSDSLVAIVSLGAARTFAIRPFGGGPRQRFELGRGDLLVMGGTAQQYFEHAIPKAAMQMPRISVMIRS